MSFSDLSNRRTNSAKQRERSELRKRRLESQQFPSESSQQSNQSFNDHSSSHLHHSSKSQRPSRSSLPSSSNPFNEDFRGHFGEEEEEERIINSERDRMQQKVHRLEAENEASLDRSIASCVASQDVSIETLTQLNVQRDQLYRIQDGLAETNDTLNTSDHILKGMKSIGGAFLNLFTPKPKPTLRKPRIVPEYNPAIAPNQAKHQKSDDEWHAGIVNKQKSPQKERESEQLDVLHGLVKNLHCIADDMHTELGAHDRILDEIDGTVDATDIRVKRQTRAINRLI